MKLKFFLWKKLLENLLLAKNLMPVAAALIIISYFTDLEVHPGPLRFFIRNSTISMRLIVLFILKVFSLKVFLLTTKVTPDFDNYL